MRGKLLTAGQALLLATLAGCAADAELSSPRVAQALERISPGAIERHMLELSDDAMEGRGTGTLGYLKSAEYVAGRLEAIGFDPAGDEQGYFQSVPLLDARPVADAISLILVRGDGPTPLILERDVLVSADFTRERAELTAPLAYAGFGVVADEHDYDDYAGIDVTGRIVAIFRGAPAWLASTERAYHASTSLKLRAAVERGAVGVLEMQLPEEHRRAPWDRVVRHSRMPSMRWLEKGSVPHDGFPELFLRARLSEAGERKLFAGAPSSLEAVIEAAEKGRPESFELDGRISIKTASRQVELDSPNVIGALRGSDPDLRDEYVVLTAHLDHVGVGDPVDGDGIYNGAYDNASGISMLLVIGEALAGLDPPPRRSILLLAVTGEEKGLLGSEYFAHHPTVPLGSIVANINLDMVLMFHPLVDMIAFGAAHSSLGPQVARAASHLGVRLTDDPIPERVFFIRSDQFSFVKQGIPALFAVSGFDSGDPGVDGMAQFDDWMSTVYHSPDDEMGQTIDFDAGARFARVNLLTTLLVADADARPTWNRDDFFGSRFGRPTG